MLRFKIQIENIYINYRGDTLDLQLKNKVRIELFFDMVIFRAFTVKFHSSDFLLQTS